MSEDKQKLSLETIKDIWVSTRRVSETIWAEKRGLVIWFAVILIALSATPFIGSGLRGILINQLVANTSHSFSTTLLIVLGVALFATFLAPLFSIFQNYISRRLYFFIEEKFDLLTIKKKGELDIGVHENPQHTDLFNKIRENGVWRIENFYDRQFFIFQNVLEVLIAVIIIGIANWWLLIVFFLGAIPELVTELRYGRKIWNIHGWRSEERRRYWNTRWHFDLTSELTELKLFQNTNHFYNIIRDLFRRFQAEQLEIERKKIKNQLAATIISQLAGAVAIVWFVFEVVHGRLQIGTLTFLLASTGELRQSFSGLFANLGRQYQDGLFVKDYFKFIDLKPVIEKPSQSIILSATRTPEIVFENVTFKYPDASEPALKRFSLTIPPGEKVALVGANGAGKTTLVKLLCRFYDPTGGRILIDGRDLRTIDLESWYTLLGVLFQDYSNYNFIVKDLIALGRTSGPLNFPLVKGAAEASEADLFIHEWEKEYEQMIGKQFTGGVEPSIGQWQKLALARAFYRDPRILILDEPTSSIDAEAEAKIFEKLESLPKDHTVILISHRFSTVRQAEKICVLETGSLTEYGTHAELLKKNKTYARLFKLQAKGYR